MKMTTFNDFPLSEEIKKSLDLLGYEKPTEVQEAMIPAVLEGRDMIVKSQTGSGKTAAFAIPLCEKLDWEENKPQALVITPTRELALQVKEEIFNIGRFKRIKAAAVFGKAPMLTQVRELKQKMHVVVGTPGRLIDHLEQGTLITDQIKYLIIDEADEMLNMGFVEQLEEIIQELPRDRVTLLLSATLPRDIEALSEEYMIDPELVTIESTSHALDRIDQMAYETTELEKFDLLRAVTTMENPDTCMIFCNTRLGVDDLHEDLSRAGYPCKPMHGGMAQRDRLRIMDGFKRGNFRYLIATGVAARGIDVDNVSLVINFDMPEDPESYVHRVGRTGRKDRRGRAVSFFTRGEKIYVKDVEAYTGRPLERLTAPSIDQVQEAEPAFLDKLSKRLERKPSKTDQLSADIMKLHINAGKKQKMRAADIVGTLCNIEGMTKDDIGVITIMDIATYVEVLNGKGPGVLKALRKKTLKGRIRKVNIADRELYPGERRNRRQVQQGGQGRGPRNPRR